MLDDRGIGGAGPASRSGRRPMLSYWSQIQAREHKSALPIRRISVGQRIGDAYRRFSTLDGFSTGWRGFGLDGRTVIQRRLVGQRRQRDIRPRSSHYGRRRTGPCRSDAADHREIEVPLSRRSRAPSSCALRAQHDQHTLLAFRQQHLVSRHEGLALRHEVQVRARCRRSPLPRHLNRRTGQAGRPHILDGDDGIRRHQLQAGLDQQFFGERIADLHGRALLLAESAANSVRGHGGAMDAVAAGLGADIDSPDCRCRRRLTGRSRSWRCDADRHRVDQRVAVIGRDEN